MGIQLPNSLYQGGNVALDSTPSVNFYRQIESERRAKQDAIDDYMRGLRSKVTPAGMRTADLPAFDKMRNEWQTFGIQNRDKIAKNPQLRAQFEAMGQDMMTFAEESKAEEAAKKPFVEMMTDPNKRQKLRPEVFGMIAEHDKPLYTTDKDGNLVRDYARKKLDYGSKLFKDPEFDFQKEYKGWIGEMKPGEIVEIDKPTTDKQTGLVFYPAKEKFNKEQIAQAGRNATRSVKDDEDKLDYYASRMAAIGQKEYQDFDNLYRKYYGEPIGKSPERLAAAEAIAAAEQFVGKETMKSKIDYERRQEDKRINIALNQGGGGSQENVYDIYKVIDDQATVSKTAGKPYLQVNLLPVDAQQVVIDFARKLTGNNELSQKNIKIIKSDTGDIGVYRASNNQLIGYLPRVGTNLKAQPGVKEKRTVIQTGEPAKTKPKKDPLGIF